jgi:hypothetical protein
VDDLSPLAKTWLGILQRSCADLRAVFATASTRTTAINSCSAARAASSKPRLNDFDGNPSAITMLTYSVSSEPIGRSPGIAEMSRLQNVEIALLPESDLSGRL